MYQEWQGQTALSLLDYSTTTWADRPCFVFDDVITTYGELASSVAGARDRLVAIGVRRGDHVATLMGSSPRWAEVFFAVLSLGGIVVPFNLTWTSREVAEGMKLNDISVLVVEARYRGQDLWAMAERAVPNLTTFLPGKTRSPELPTLRCVIALRSEGCEREVPPYAFDLASLEKRAAPAPQSQVRPEDPAIMLLTSGTTSFPKSAILSHRALTCGWATFADAVELTERSVFLQSAPNYHVAGINLMGMTLLRGGLGVIMRWFDPERALELFDTKKVTHFYGFDTHFSMMRDAPGYGRWDVSSVKHTITSSNPAASKKMVEMGFEHHGSVYGSTEFMGAQAFFPRRDLKDHNRMLKSNGRATCGELRIVDIETGAALGPNQSGEICVRGPCLFSGYYKRPDETAKVIDEEGFFHSGDRGYLDEDGYLYYLGRFKEMIKTGGENVSILEVEQFLLSAVPGVRRVAVCATPHPKWGEAVTAVVVPTSGASEVDIIAACRGSLAGYKIPKRVILVDDSQWSVTPTGKVDRKIMQAVALAALGLSNSMSTEKQN
jgi:fatty-acyl-CoA synthase